MKDVAQHILAVFVDFENLALGFKDRRGRFEIGRVLARLVDKGNIVVKRAYADWKRYSEFTAELHEAGIELIEIPARRLTGKNSADMRLCVDAMDMSYSKSHIDTFVVVSGDSDFSPLVSKLRENAKYVIGVGVKQSTSDLLIANCDEFIFYDDLVRDSQREAARRDPRAAQERPRRTPEEERKHREDKETRKRQAIELAVETFDALVAERGDSGKIWASVLKEAIKRRKPDFNESYYGFRAFGNLLDEAQARGLLECGRDEKSGAFVFRSNTTPARPEAEEERPAERSEALPATTPVPPQEFETPPASATTQEGRRRGRNSRSPGGRGGRSRAAAERQEATAGLPAAPAGSGNATPAANRAPTELSDGEPAAPAIAAPPSPRAPMRAQESQAFVAPAELSVNPDTNQASSETTGEAPAEASKPRKRATPRSAAPRARRPRKAATPPDAE
jgi:uncharacterized protein (TIGR00288 family)